MCFLCQEYGNIRRISHSIHSFLSCLSWKKSFGASGYKHTKMCVYVHSTSIIYNNPWELGWRKELSLKYYISYIIHSSSTVQFNWSLLRTTTYDKCTFLWSVHLVTILLTLLILVSYKLLVSFVSYVSYVSWRKIGKSINYISIFYEWTKFSMGFQYIKFIVVSLWSSWFNDRYRWNKISWVKF